MYLISYKIILWKKKTVSRCIPHIAGHMAHIGNLMLRHAFPHFSLIFWRVGCQSEEMKILINNNWFSEDRIHNRHVTVTPLCPCAMTASILRILFLYEHTCTINASYRITYCGVHKVGPRKLRNWWNETTIKWKCGKIYSFPRQFYLSKAVFTILIILIILYYELFADMPQWLQMITFQWKLWDIKTNAGRKESIAV